MLNTAGLLSEIDAAAHCEMKLPAFRQAVQSGKLPRPVHGRMWSTLDLDRKLAKINARAMLRLSGRRTKTA